MKNEYPYKSHVHVIEGSVSPFYSNHYLHDHDVHGLTSKEIHIGKGKHVHDIYIVTTNSKGHTHFIRARVGPNIRVGNSHIHYLQTKTTVENYHYHRLKIVTSLPKKWRLSHKITRRLDN